MHPRQILTVALRTAALLILLRTLSAVIAIYAGNREIGADLEMTYWMYAANAACCVVLWLEAAPQEPPKHPAPWLTTGIALIGLFTLINAVSDTLYLATRISYIRSLDAGVSVWQVLDTDGKAAVLINVFELLAGALLLFRAGAFSRWLRGRCCFRPFSAPRCICSMPVQWVMKTMHAKANGR